MNPGDMQGNLQSSSLTDIIQNESMLAEILRAALDLAEAPLLAQVEAFKSTDSFARYAGIAGDRAHGDVRALAHGFKFWCEQMQINLPQIARRHTSHPAGGPLGIDADSATALEFYVAQEAASDPDVRLARKALLAAQEAATWGIRPGDGMLAFLNAASRWELSELFARWPEAAPPYVDPFASTVASPEPQLEFSVEALQEARSVLQPQGRRPAEEWLSHPVVLALTGPFAPTGSAESSHADPQAIPAYDRHGILKRLLELSTAVAARFRWSQPAAMGYFAFGQVPAIAGSGEAQLRTESHPLLALSRIHMDIDPRVSPLEVRKAYEIERRTLLKNDRAKSLKHTYLGFFWGLPDTKKMPTRLAQVEAWNELTTDWGLPTDYEYPTTPQGLTNFARDARAARLRILHFGRQPLAPTKSKTAPDSEPFET